MPQKTAMIVLLGAPGSGKGTQAKLLASRHSGWEHVSTGDLFRREIASGSPLGHSVKDTIAQGKLVSDQITNQVFASQVQQLITQKRPQALLLDGYPRNRPQAQFLLAFQESHKDDLGALQLVEFVISEEAVVERLSGRLINPRTGRIYHRVHNPPKKAGFCDEDGGELVQRPDDQPETIRARYRLYIQERDGILEALGGQRVQVKAQGGQLEVTEALEKALGSPRRS